MKKLLGLLLLSVIWGLFLNSQNIITPYSRLIINNYSTKHYNHYPLIKSINSDFQNYIPAFITLEDKSNTNLSDLESLGIKIEGRYHNVIASLIPINHFEDASNIKGIKISQAKHVKATIRLECCHSSIWFSMEPTYPSHILEKV